MYATELIGKNCIREKPVIIERYTSTGGGLFAMYGGGEKLIKDPDYTYCKESVRIVAATEHNIVCEVSGRGLTGKPFIVNLDERYCDDSWVDYDALVGSGAGFSGKEPETGDGNEQGT